MSDLMLFGVLRMPYEMAMGNELSRRQFYDRVQEAADRLEAADRATPPSPSTAPTKCDDGGNCGVGGYCITCPHAGWASTASEVGELPSRAQINDWMRDAGWQNSGLRQDDLDKVEKVVRAALAATHRPDPMRDNGSSMGMGELPPLPKAAFHTQHGYVYFADQMRAYGQECARAALAAKTARAQTADPRIEAFYKLRDIAERDGDPEAASIISAAIAKLAARPSTGDVDVEAERGLFEASGVTARLRRCTEPGYTDQYEDLHTQIAWKTWLVARSTHARVAKDAGLLDAVGKLIKAKGRYHTEQNYKALVDAYDAARRTQAEGTKTKPISDDELLAWMRPHLDNADGGYLCKTEPQAVIAAGRAAIAAVQKGE